MEEEPQFVTTESPSDTGETVQLDPEGDATLVVNGLGCTKRYLVSSRVLSLASPVFSRLFGPNFKEGQELRRGERPCISLEEDDPTAMGLILGILHYKCAQVPLEMEPNALLTVAVHIDKYDCIEALRPWAAHWCSTSFQGITTPEGLGSVLLAAYMLRSPSFSDITARIVKLLAPGFDTVWAEREALAPLPGTITATLSRQIADKLKKLHEGLHYVERSLRNQQTEYTMPSLVCRSCRRDLPAVAKKCHPCRNTDLLNKTCTSEHRVAEYFRILNRCRLWSSVEPFTTSSLSELLSRIRCTQIEDNHKCGAGEMCPLKDELSSFLSQAEMEVRNVEGISFEDIGVV